MKTALLLASLIMASILAPGTPAYATEPIVNCHRSGDGGSCAARSDCMINIETGATTCSRDTLERAAVGTVTHAMLFTEPNLKGYALRYVSNEPCTPDKTKVEYGDRSFDDPFWDDEFESVQSYHDCAVRLYESANYGGESTNWIHESADLGTSGNSANSASSIEIS